MANRATVYIAGAGRVGLGLGQALQRQGHTVAGVWNRSEEGRRQAEALLGVSAEASFGAALGDAAWVLVCVSDRAVASVGEALARSGRLGPGALVAHTSGYLPASALGEIAGACRGSLHPLVACATAEQAARQLLGASFAIEGDAAALEELHRVVAALEGRAHVIASAAKPRYHAALVMAANLAVALEHQALAEARAAGFADERAVLELARGAIDLALAHGTVAGLTGPLVRGDAATVAGHLQALSAAAQEVYRPLARVALRMAEERGLAPSDARALEALLDS
jgi:predicted short-subunit dehydrogenase-like oxidoreductase (DUF2520 family)